MRGRRAGGGTRLAWLMTVTLPAGWAWGSSRRGAAAPAGFMHRLHSGPHAGGLRRAADAAEPEHRVLVSGLEFLLFCGAR